MNPNHPAKPTSQQVEPLSAQNMAEILRISRAHVPLTTRSISSRRIFDRMAAIEDGSHVVISATELSALRAREERLRELVKSLRQNQNNRIMYEHGERTVFEIAADELESILNEGKTK